jgi:prevent-host-death family protein
VLQLCVMSRRQLDRVGIRELRQNLSVYVKRVREEGRAYDVTERGEPVARLVPLPGRPMSAYERLVSEGRIAPPTHDLLDVKPLEPLKGRQLSDVLREMREEETW